MLLEEIMKIGDSFPICLTIVDIKKSERPCLYVNSKFEKYTGYSKDEVLGKNLSLLQGPETDIETIHFMRKCFQQNEACIQDIINYTKSGDLFLNRLMMIPIEAIYNGKKDTFYLGFQHNMTDIKGLKPEESLMRVKSAEINHIVKNSLAIVFGKILNPKNTIKDSKEMFLRDESIIKAISKINSLLVEAETISEFECFEYL